MVFTLSAANECDHILTYILQTERAAARRQCIENRRAELGQGCKEIG